MRSVAFAPSALACTTSSRRKSFGVALALRVQRSSAAPRFALVGSPPCAASLSSSSLQVHLPPRPSRVKEVEAACSALAESVREGDEAWFDRLVVQLRSVLDERREEIRAPDADGAFTRGGAVSSSATGPPQRFGARTTVAEAPEIASVGPGSAAEDEPAWLQALRLLEAAALNGTSQGRGPTRSSAHQERPGNAPASRPSAGPPRAGGDPDQASFDAGLADYLDSFAPAGANVPRSLNDQSAKDGMEPDWARALRLLEAAGNASRRSKTPGSPEAMEEPSWARALRLLEAAGLEERGAGLGLPQSAGGNLGRNSGTDGRDAVNALRSASLLRVGSGSSSSTSSFPVDPAQSVRISRYSELMREADRIGNVAPGASVPSMRFGDLTKQSGSPPRGASATIPPPPRAEKLPESATFPIASSSLSAPKPAVKKSSFDDPMVQAVGKGNLMPAMPGPADEDPLDNAELRKEDFVWSEHEFNDGEKENKRVLRGFRREFKKMTEATPEGVRNPRLLTAALDLALACVKCYELDKADAIYRRIVGECRRRGMPWDVKCIQDMATLRCKQHRQADAAELLEELASKAPPHPATFINLGTVYNQLRQYDRAESWFRQAVNLKGGEPGREDLWNLGICRKNQQKYDEALPMLEQALAEFQEHEPEHPVTIAKLHSSVGGCLHDMGRTAEAAKQYRQAYDLYVATVGKMSPLFCSAAEGLAKALRSEQDYGSSFDALVDSFEVHAKGDAVHPTPLFEGLEMALDIHAKEPSTELVRMAPLIDAAVENMDKRGLAEDGNAGLVMSRGGKLLIRAGAESNSEIGRRAQELLSRGVRLIRQSHDSGEAELSHEIMEANMLLQQLQKNTVPP